MATETRVAGYCNNAMVELIEITDDELNLFVDKQLDKNRTEKIYEIIFSDSIVRKQIYEIIFIRQLVAYSYNDIPISHEK